MKHLLRPFAFTVALLLAASAARAADWTEDYAGALAQAKKEHKMVLLDFTGSDWCIWCQRTDKEVFDTPRFKEYADKKLILVRLDFPREKPQVEAIKDQNAKLMDKYGVEAFPTLVVLGPDEKVVYSQLGYKDGGPDAFIDHLTKPST
ncbi:MAG TPA: thioredoxin family protein [Opitutaceae bacterium]